MFEREENEDEEGGKIRNSTKKISFYALFSEKYSSWIMVNDHRVASACSWATL